MKCHRSVSRGLDPRGKGDLWESALTVMSLFHFRLIGVLRFVVNFSTIVEQLINNSSQTTVLNFCLHS